ncbi:MAG: DUF748 domain-containing protein [Nibricoccus sp.]
MKLSRRFRGWLIAFVAFLTLYTVVGFFVLPPIVKAQAEKSLSAELGRIVHLGKVRMNPFALSVTLEDFDIREKDAQASFVGWKRLYVNVSALASVAGDWVVGDVELDGFHAAVAINPDNTFNFSDLLAKIVALPKTPSTAPSTKPPRPVRVGRLAVTQARLDFSDRSRRQPFATVVGPLTFTLNGFRTAGARGAPYHFEAVTEAGEKFSWTGTLAADPIESKGSFEIANLILKKYTPYFEDRVRADLTDGKLSLSGHYEARLLGNERTMKLNDGQVRLRDLTVVDRAGAQPAVELTSLDVDGIQADAITLKAAVARVALAKGHLAVRRAKDGSINLLSMLQPDGSATSGSAATPASNPLPVPEPTPPPATAAPLLPTNLPDVRVGEFALKDFAVDVTDDTSPRPAKLALNSLQFSLKNITLTEAAAMPLDLSFSWAPEGTVHVVGKITLKPELGAELTTEVTGLGILPLSPYIEQFANARITQGTVSTTNTVNLTLPGGQPAVAFAGNIMVDKLGLVDSAHNEDLAGFSSLTVTNLKATTSPQLAASIDEIKVNAPYARVLVNADKTINLTTIAKTPSLAPGEPSETAVPPTTGTAPTAPPAALPKVDIGRVVIAGGDFSYSDHSIEPNVQMAMTQFGGTISGLSSENLTRGDVDLKGVVNGAGPIAISGKLDPLGARKFVDLKIDFKNMDLLPISPYTGKFAGYNLARGKLQVDTKVLLDGTKVDATNLVTLHQFTFGAATNSPDATSLPVRLGIALLKDLDGKIVIDLPVQGSLDDPNFRIGKVVLRVIVNLLTKAAVSPFSLIGSMFGGGGEELAYQEFAPGTSELLATEQPKLETLIKALTNRPGLSVSLEGGYDVAADAYALKSQKFADYLRRQIWEARHAANPNIPPPEQLVITPEERAAEIKKLFDAKFPPGTKFGTPLPQPPAIAAPPPPPKAGFFKRVYHWITFRAQREKLAANRENKRRAEEHEKAVAAAAATGLPVEEMTARLAETMPVNDNDLRALGVQRAEHVRDYLINVGKISPDRLFLGQSTGATTENKGPRVFLNLQ